MLRATPHEADLHVLLVEDDDDDALTFTRVLADGDAQAFLARAEHGRRAVAYLNEAHASATMPDLIVLDLNMPIMSGQEFLVWLRNDPRFKAVQVVVLTTSREREVLLEVRELGANAALSKEMSDEDATHLRQMIIDYWFAGNIDQLDSSLEPAA